MTKKSWHEPDISEIKVSATKSGGEGTSECQQAYGSQEWFYYGTCKS
ncbi:hypothetical protein SPSYN_00822 [Sporotomaculum syntrophicum]|uniref:Paeninodin family lasso peptide n=1 Tax=Sporotomaculum syntrophicum TaxID=182264 RepID=A0A9D3AZN2_9FIRM|nr:hypothetical protein [Sporotomaculum syntrophicum]KAF1086084.1 hypothetical protein SPSYN_00822 [Sporotomaculum syntrophicum]